MAEPNNPKTHHEHPKLSNPQSTSKSPSTKPSIEAHNNGSTINGSNSGQRIHFTNPPESVNPDAATLRDQWRFAIRQYSRWYSHAWGTAILAGGAFFALGWIIKGGNPLPSKESDHRKSEGSSTSAQNQGEK
ncbi:uncharacterized protein LOC110693698 [Chenopodium quinoa]|uniref:Uncharacterized protein n=1 Tax=Chenopodium quinoa TaxID=63459 RepID=A0A803LLQ3_CHEQI|nr:uncharacterized protein LOC110693698 [Chenopodium quinoa]XP_021726559.1 uncharacterized protein LOC110693698 [Chenopodium quinoa]